MTNCFSVHHTTFFERDQRYKEIICSFWSTLFPIRVDHFSKGNRTISTELPPMKEDQFPLNICADTLESVIH